MRDTQESQSSADEESNRRRPVSSPGTLIVASNRQPYRHEYADSEEDAGSDESVANDRADESAPENEDTAGVDADEDRPITVDAPTGGLTAGLDPVVQRSGGTWIAWGDGEADRAVADDSGCVQVPPEEESYTLQRLWLSDEAVDSYYYGFSNRVLWPLCHEFPDLIDHRDGDYEWYRDVNRTFAESVVEHATDDAVIWLQDYHLGLAPTMIRDAVPSGAVVVQFWHIPWPSPGVFERCPRGEELLRGLLGNDMLGFHVDRYRDAFLDCVDRFLPEATVDRRRHVVRYDGHETRVTASPMGVDAKKHAAKSRTVDETRWRSLLDRYDIPKNVTLALGLDRLDYSKGIPDRLAAIERLFERRPEWTERFTFFQKATPSRTDIPAYAEYGELVRDEVERINDRFGTDDWDPIVYTEDVLPREDLCALYRYADAMIVSPLIDGMNLVAQEYVAASVDGEGVLILSDGAGVHELLGEEAFTIEPTATDEFAATVERSLTATTAERRRRMKRMRSRVFDENLESWMAAQFAEIERIRDGSRSKRRSERSTPL